MTSYSNNCVCPGINFKGVKESSDVSGQFLNPNNDFVPNQKDLLNHGRNIDLIRILFPFPDRHRRLRSFPFNHDNFVEQPIACPDRHRRLRSVHPSVFSALVPTQDHLDWMVISILILILISTFTFPKFDGKFSIVALEGMLRLS